jgi:hypothetical protein
MILKNEWVALNDKAGDGPLTALEQAFLIEGLRQQDEQTWMCATAVVSAADKQDVLAVLAIFKSLRLEVKKALLPILAAMEFYEPFWMMFEELKNVRDEAYEWLLIHCLGKTRYPIFPLLLYEMDEASLSYMGQLKRILKVMGFAAVKPLLEVMPVIPHEGVFRDVFGDDLIKLVK